MYQEEAHRQLTCIVGLSIGGWRGWCHQRSALPKMTVILSQGWHATGFCAGTVFAFNAYHIGKEGCYFQVAARCNLQVWVNARRARTLRRLQLSEEWLRCLVKDKSQADVIVSDHGVGPPQLQQLQRELNRPVVGFQCTGAAPRVRSCSPQGLSGACAGTACDSIDLFSSSSESAQPLCTSSFWQFLQPAECDEHGAGKQQPMIYTSHILSN
jgi:hypothetical protein